MKLAFNFHGCGAGNNGGTRTVFRSAIELSRFGVDVEIWSNHPNQFTWFRLPKEIPFIVRSKIAEHDPADVVIATGAASVDSTVKCSGNNWYWVRGIENWSKSKEELIRGYKSGLHLMANATWMKDWIKKHADVPCEVVWPGLELEFFSPPENKEKSPIVVGALYSQKPRKRAGDIENCFKRLKMKYGDSVRLILLSNEKPPDGFPCDAVFHRPSEEDKRAMYQKTHIWFAPTDNEGLHVPPMEAGLCGCALVSHGMLRAGMGDYAFNGKTAFVYPKYNIDEALRMLCVLVEDHAKRETLANAFRRYLVSRIGSREENMLNLLTKVAGEELVKEVSDRIVREGREPTDKEYALLNYEPLTQGIPEKLTYWPKKQVTPFLRLLKATGIPKSGRILDMGCRIGEFLFQLKNAGCENVEGIDISEQFVRRAALRDLNVRVANVCDTGLVSGTYDAVYSRHVMEHIPHPEVMIREQIRILKRGGVAINQFPVSVPSAKHFAFSEGDSDFKPVLEHIADYGGEILFYGPSDEGGFFPQGSEKTIVIRRLV